MAALRSAGPAPPTGRQSSGKVNRPRVLPVPRARVHVRVRAPVHVAVGGEGLAAHGALVGPLAAVHQHVSVQRGGGAQALPADAAGVVGGARVRVVLRGQEARSRWDQRWRKGVM